jgi:hypothetical protein
MIPSKLTNDVNRDVIVQNNSTNPSDPNSIKDLGALVDVLPVRVDIDQINENFTLDTKTMLNEENEGN